MDTARKKRKKQNQYRRQKGKCWWCGRKMRLWHKHKNGSPVPDDLATFEHLDDRFSEWRGKSPGMIRVVLACYRCNHTRGQEAEAKEDIEDIWERSQAYPMGHPKAVDRYAEVEDSSE